MIADVSLVFIFETTPDFISGCNRRGGC